MIEHENSRLIGQLIGQMEGMTNELRRLNTTMEASVEATHQRFDYERREVNARFDRHENEIREIKTAKALAIAHVRGGAWTIGLIITLITTGALTAINAIIGVFNGLKP